MHRRGWVASIMIGYKFGEDEGALVSTSTGPLVGLNKGYIDGGDNSGRGHKDFNHDLSLLVFSLSTMSQISFT